MNAKEYLHRIRLSGPLTPSYDALCALQQAHLTSVPYENLDILRGVPIALDWAPLYDKIVRRGRGGYCFELNELFGWLLRALGFAVEDYFARFLRGEAGIPMRRHHVLGVCALGDARLYIADVGVGTGSPMHPVALIEGVVQRQGAAEYRFSRDEVLGWVLEEHKRGAWEAVYSFTLEKQLPVDFLAASYYCEHAPDSLFNKAPMISLRTADGRRTLDGEEFRHFSAAGVEVSRVADEAAHRARLAEWFGIVL